MPTTEFPIKFPEPVREGSYAALPRLYERWPQLDRSTIDELLESVQVGIRTMVDSALSRHEPSSPPFVQLFSEVVTVAWIARTVNKEDPLSMEEVGAFMDFAVAFFNCFRHLS